MFETWREYDTSPVGFVRRFNRQPSERADSQLIRPQVAVIGSLGFAAFIDTFVAGSLTYFIQRHKMRDETSWYLPHIIRAIQYAKY